MLISRQKQVLHKYFKSEIYQLRYIFLVSTEADFQKNVKYKCRVRNLSPLSQCFGQVYYIAIGQVLGQI